MWSGFQRGLIVRLATRRRWGIIVLDEGGKDVRFYVGALKIPVTGEKGITFQHPSAAQRPSLMRVHRHVWFQTPVIPGQVTTIVVFERDVEADLSLRLEQDVLAILKDSL